MKWKPVVWMAKDGEYVATIRRYPSGGLSVVLDGPNCLTVSAAATKREAMRWVETTIETMRAGMLGWGPGDAIYDEGVPE